MVATIVYAIACYSLWESLVNTNIPIVSVVRDKIASKSGVFTQFLYCPLCSGFWVSLAVAYLLPLPLGSTVLPEVALFVQALSGSGVIFMVEKYVSSIEGRL